MGHKSVMYILTVIVIALCLVCARNGLTAGPFDITIGQDTVFTEGNIKLSSGDAFSDGTFAFARVEAGPYTSGRSDASIGFSLNVIQNAEALTSMFAEVTVSYRYSIDVDFLDIIPMGEGGGGSADIQLVANAIDPLFRTVNFVHHPNSYVESDTVSTTATFILNAGGLGLSYSFDLDAHADVYKGNFARAYVEVEIIEVKIDFIEDIMAVITTTPETPYLGQLISFDSSQSQGENFVEWDWFIDDIPVASVPSMSHTFLETGTYRISLRMVDQYGREDTDEKILSFQPIMTIRPNAANFHTTIYDEQDVLTKPVSQSFIIQNDGGANADLICLDISLPLGGPFKKITDTCTHTPVAKGDSCEVTVKVQKPENGATNLQISHNGNTSPRSIPLVHTVTSLRFDRDRELTQEGRKRFKALWEGQQPAPPDINVYDQINDYRGLEGKQFFFGPPAAPSPSFSSSADGETALPTIIFFGTELSTMTTEDGTIVPYLPCRIYEDGEENGWGVILVDFLGLEAGDGWFVSFESGLTENIGDVVVPVDKFVMFTLNNDPVYGYSITTNLETDVFLEMDLFEGSKNLFDFVSSLVADQDSDSDIDGKDLSSFLNNAIQGDPSADVNGDGTINESDLAYLALIFGACR